jgi:hypothetical protein
MSDTSKLRSAFVVQHVHVLPDGVEDVKLVGVYSSRRTADDAILRTRLLEGFKDAPDGFFVDEYALDKDAWQEGYSAVNNMFP